MKIGIVTIYEAVTNLGSYLQAYALQTALQEMGHEVVFIEKESAAAVIKRCVCRLNPKRAFFLRIQKCIQYIKAKKLLRTIPKERLPDEKLDCLIYGSDEIWNMENSYFCDPLFWGTVHADMPRIAYAASVGAMRESTLEAYADVADGVRSFSSILVRDDRTKEMIGAFVGKELPLVCDPTLLIPLKKFSKPIKLPKEKYLLVYTYGVDKPTEELIVRFAREKRLKIISPCFWHIWCDKVIECEPLQFSTLIEHAEYVFTSTFHGAIFTMLNHKKCAVLPIRSKVRDVVERMGAAEKLITEDCSYEEFSAVMEAEFPAEEFDLRLNATREKSLEMLKGALACLEK